MFLSESAVANIGFKSVGENIKIDSSVTFFHPQNISIGSHVRIDGQCMLTASDSIVIGSYVHISWGCLIYGDSPITLEDFSGLAPRVCIFGSSDDYVGGALSNPTVDIDLRNIKSGPVTLGMHALIGTNSVISPGVTIARGASVGALSHVNKNLPEFSVSAGCPAKPITQRNKEKLLQSESEMRMRSIKR